MPVLDFQAFVFALPLLLATSLIHPLSGKALTVLSWVIVCRPIVLNCDSQIKHFSISCKHMGVARGFAGPMELRALGLGPWVSVTHSPGGWGLHPSLT